MSRGIISKRTTATKLDGAHPWLDLRFSSWIRFIFYLSSVEQASIFLQYFFTDYEKEAFLQRWHILVYLMTTDLSYEKIASSLKCSTRTVSRVAREIEARLPDETRRILKSFFYPRNKDIQEEEIKEKARALRKMKGGAIWASLLEKQIKSKRFWWKELINSPFEEENKTK